MNTVQISTSQLEGAALDWAVAHATKAWEWAHRLFPTMTLDSTFKGVVGRPYPRGEFGSCLPTCVLVPNNSMRQEPSPFCPSISWEQCGPLIEELHVDMHFNGVEWLAQVDTLGPEFPMACKSKSALEAVCRAIVVSRLGEEVDIPKELMP
ncbi:phage protein NinX family protein [Pseudomonas aeruginosa]|nr:DUF2591 family protein [Pseudomonas aeruginosa]